MYIRGVENGRKKCNDDGGGKKQRSEQSLDSVSKRPTTVASSSVAIPSDADVAATATEAADSDWTLADSGVDASESASQRHELVIGLPLTTSYLYQCHVTSNSAPPPPAQNTTWGPRPGNVFLKLCFLLFFCVFVICIFRA